MKEDIPQLIRILRKRNRLTQIQFSGILGISQSKLSKLESGELGLNAEDLLLMLTFLFGTKKVRVPRRKAKSHEPE